MNLLKQLDPEWELRVQQMQVDEGRGERAHYQDVYKGPIAGLDEENVEALFEKATYLNSDDKWVTPVYISTCVIRLIRLRPCRNQLFL